MPQKKILVVTTGGIPHPDRGASTVLIYEYIRALVSECKQVSHLLVVDHSTNDAELIGHYTDCINRHGMVHVRPVLLDQFVRWKKTTKILQPVEIESGNMADVMRDEYDLIVSFDISAVALVHRVSAKSRAVWLGDLTYQSLLYHGLYGIKERDLSLKEILLHLFLSYRWKQFYRQLLGCYDCIIVSSNPSVAAIGKLGYQSVYLPYPWPDTNKPVPSQRALANKPVFLFFGTLSGLGSRSAFHFILDKLYPGLLNAWGKNGFTIRICGSRSLPAWVLERLKTMPELNFLGFVDDLHETMLDVHAVIAPIDVPVGNRSRIITALAMQVPVIAHRNTSLTNPMLVHDETCYLADDADSFIQGMKKVVDDMEYARTLVTRARQAYEHTFLPKPACDAFMHQIRPMIQALPGA